MTKKIIVSTIAEESRMALLEDERLAELIVERTDSDHIVGNIYKGKIRNVLPGMQAAFIDIGREKNAFLYIGDMEAKSQTQHSGKQSLTVGQDIVIQIVKDALGVKGPRATTHITLPGRYVVLMPTVDYIGISRRIGSDTEKHRLKELAEKICPPGMGMIVRTVAEGKSEEALRKDIEYLANLWSSLLARAKRSSAPAALYRDVDLVIRIVRDYLTPDVTELIIDNHDAFHRAADLLNFMSPELLTCLKLYEQREDVFSFYKLTEEVEKLGERQVWLKSGGYLVIDKTEALTVIDVNTGRFIGQTSLAETVFQTNLEAAAEIARQIRLRDIGGIIIIDFIDMEQEHHKQAVLDSLETHFKKDRTKTHVIGLTGLGLVEMTRKKARQNLETTLYAECPCCKGRGHIESPETICLKIKREIRKKCAQHRIAESLIIQVHPRVADILKKDLVKLGEEVSRTLLLEAVPTMHDEAFCIIHQKE
ncbi:MAG: Rne/Rng family ribonuclease [Pelosinus sp.]|nr:Rne/Rng family ribonuclease [Pelosinus sp.]